MADKYHFKAVIILKIFLKTLNTTPKSENVSWLDLFVVSLNVAVINN